jgi:uncharacterized repeat protein (TIGR02543 family)
MELLTQKTGKRIFFQKSVFTILLALVTVFACEVEEPVPTYTLTTSVTPSEGGKISVSPQESNYVEGSQVTLTPEPNENWVFKQWEGDATGNTTPLQLTMTANKNVVGVFVKRDYPLNIKIEGEGTVEEKIVSNPSGREYPHGTTVELTPKPKEGWEFDGWAGDLTGKDVPKRITVDKQKNVTAKFERKKFLIHSIKVENAPKNMGSVHAIYYVRNGKEYIIDGSVNWNDPNNATLPLFRIRRGENQWVVDNIYSNVDLSDIRNHEMLKNGEGIAIGEHGPEWPNLPWPHSNLYLGKFSGDNILWEKVSEKKSFYHDIAVGDLNSDGMLDVAGAHMGSRFGNPDNPHIYFGKGNGIYKEQISVLPSGDFPGGCCGDVEIVDFDGDSKNELLGIGGGTDYPFTSIKIWKFNSGTQNFQLSKYISNPIPSIAPQAGSYNTLQKGNVSPTGGFTGNMPTNKRFYDLNKDGRKDMILESDGLTLWYNQGNETFTPFRLNEQGKDLGAYFENYYAMSGYDVIDIENDNDPDIVTRIFTFGNPNTTTGIDLRKLIYINDQGSFDRLTSTDYFLSNAQLSQQYPNMLKAIVRNGYLWFIGPSFKNDGAGPYQIMLEVQTDIPASYWYESQ